jgi:DNA-binding NarL/FixJ family response regulator
VLIANDHAILRAGLKLLINTQRDMQVVGEAEDGAETVSRARELDCDVVLIDLVMPGAPGTAIIEQLARLQPRPRILVLTGHDDPALERSALQAGASGYIVKAAHDVDLLAAIRLVHSGGTFASMTRAGKETSRTSPAGGPSRRLSPREGEVLRLLAQGHTNQEAADRLAVSVKTIETHRKRLSHKLALKTRAELFRFAVEIGLLEGDAGPPGDE